MAGNFYRTSFGNEPRWFWYRVTFNIPGCLPEADPVEFDSLDEVSSYIEQEWEAVAGDDPAWNDDAGNGTPAYRDALDAIASIHVSDLDRSTHVDHPEPGNSYRWHIEYVVSTEPRETEDD
jgi:hypothetical protein